MFTIKQLLPNKDEIKAKSLQGGPNKAEIEPEKLDQHDNRTFRENTLKGSVIDKDVSAFKYHGYSEIIPSGYEAAMYLPGEPLLG